MKKILLDLRMTDSKEALYDLVAKELSFPDYFGKNLDALYDLLGEISEDTCIGIFLPPYDGEDLIPDSFQAYLDRVRRTFLDAENSNPHLCVIAFIP